MGGCWDWHDLTHLHVNGTGSVTRFAKNFATLAIVFKSLEKNDSLFLFWQNAEPNLANL